MQVLLLLFDVKFEDAVALTSRVCGCDKAVSDGPRACVRARACVSRELISLFNVRYHVTV